MSKGGLRLQGGLRVSSTLSSVRPEQFGPELTAEGLTAEGRPKGASAELPGEVCTRPLFRTRKLPDCGGQRQLALPGRCLHEECWSIGVME